MKRKALIVYGGWEGHDPANVAHIFKKFLEESDFEVDRATQIGIGHSGYGRSYQA